MSISQSGVTFNSTSGHQQNPLQPESLSARAIFREFPRIKRRLWGGELWEDGYFARTVGDKVTAEVIRRYIQQHRLEKSGDAQLSLFE